jgi:cytochrome c-type biogenesis protein CcmH/NrfG
MTASRGSLRHRDCAIVFAVLLAVAAAAWLLTRLLFATQARSVLAVHFTSIPATSGQAVEIWLHNARSTLGVAVFAVARPVSHRLLGDRTPSLDRAIVRVCDSIIGLWAIGYAAAGGALLGAYGTRQLRTYLPEGPVEIAAWVLLVVLYLDLRRGRVTLSQAALRLAGVVAILGMAAVLELWAGL